MKPLLLLITIGIFIPLYGQTDVANQRLAKALDVLEKTEAVVKAQTAEIAAKNAEIAARDAENKALATQIRFLELTVKAREEEVAALRKIKCSSVSLFWGIVKRKACD